MYGWYKKLKNTDRSNSYNFAHSVNVFLFSTGPIYIQESSSAPLERSVRNNGIICGGDPKYVSRKLNDIKAADRSLFMVWHDS